MKCGMGNAACGKGRSATRGFTLLELLLALALTVVVVAALAASLYTAFRARTNAMEAVESSREISTAGDIIVRDLADCLPPTPPALNAGTIQGLSGANTTGTLIGPFEGLADSVDCFISGPQPKAPTQGDVREVVYLVEADPSGKGGNVLARRVTSNLLAQQLLPDPDEVICRNVVDMHLSYFDGTDWNDTWDSTAQTGTLLNCLPVAIAITLDLAPYKRGEPNRETVRYVPMSSFKPQTQTVPTVTVTGGSVTGL
jgi:prepilin-type N-terminal cleavage/methylation domain-containing protein